MSGLITQLLDCLRASPDGHVETLQQLARTSVFFAARGGAMGKQPDMIYKAHLKWINAACDFDAAVFKHKRGES